MSMQDSEPPQVLDFLAARGARRPENEVDATPISMTALAAMRELQAISTQLIQEGADSLHDAILAAAQRLLRYDMAPMQVFDVAGDGLKMLSWRGFDVEHIKAFDWVGRDAGSSCAAALRAGARVVIPDIETSDHVVGTPAHPALRLCGIRSAQSTPLVSRSGIMLGMITNHWREPHAPGERALLLIDVLARQAADLIDRNNNEQHVALLAREAEHRAKNMLAAVQAVVRMTRAQTAEELRTAITGRVNALDNVHRLFVQANWSGADLGTLIAGELAPYRQREDRNATLSGPDIMLAPNTAQAVSMILHELATNAAKYGAFSAFGGHVRVDWARRDDGVLVLRWDEGGGPAVTPPAKRGVGTKVM